MLAIAALPAHADTTVEQLNNKLLAGRAGPTGAGVGVGPASAGSASADPADAEPADAEPADAGPADADTGAGSGARRGRRGVCC